MKGMGTGHGWFGSSTANMKGTKRLQCPVCGETYVVGSRNYHNENGGSVLAKFHTYYCPRTEKHVEVTDDFVEKVLEAET
jgi:hypothetical protein